MKPGSHAARAHGAPAASASALASRAGGSRLGSCASFSGKCEHDKSASAKAAHTASITDLSNESVIVCLGVTPHSAHLHHRPYALMVL